MITLSYDKELDASIYTVEGNIEYSELSNMIENYYKGILTKYTIGDYTLASTEKHLTKDETIQLGNLISRLGKARPRGYDLVIAPEIIQYGIARMFSGFSEPISKDTQKLTTKIFRTKAEAISFIRRNELLKG